MESGAPPTDPPETTVSVVPDVRSNAGSSSRRGAASAPEVISVSSADRAATVAASANASAAAALALDDVGQRRIVPAHVDAAQRARERHTLFGDLFGGAHDHVGVLPIGILELYRHGHVEHVANLLHA